MHMVRLAEFYCVENDLITTSVVNLACGSAVREVVMIYGVYW